MAPVVRPARVDDLAAVLDVLRDLPVTTGESAEFEVDIDRATVVWQTILAQENRTFLVAEEAGEIVGTLDLLVVPNLTHDASPWAIVENVCVREGLRGQGTGKALMEDAIDRARKAGCYKVQLLSFSERTEAHRFYSSLGFEPLAVGFRMYF